MGKSTWKIVYGYEKHNPNAGRCSLCAHHEERGAMDYCVKHGARVSFWGVCGLFRDKASPAPAPVSHAPQEPLGPMMTLGLVLAACHEDKKRSGGAS